MNNEVYLDKRLFERTRDRSLSRVDMPTQLSEVFHINLAYTVKKIVFFPGIDRLNRELHKICVEHCKLTQSEGLHFLYMGETFQSADFEGVRHRHIHSNRHIPLLLHELLEPNIEQWLQDRKQFHQDIVCVDNFLQTLYDQHGTVLEILRKVLPTSLVSQVESEVASTPPFKEKLAAITGDPSSYIIENVEKRYAQAISVIGVRMMDNLIQE